MRKLNSKDSMDNNFRRLYYVRYVDNFVVDIIGSRKDAINIQNKIRIFLQDFLKLTLNEKKTWVINLNKILI